MKSVSVIAVVSSLALASCGTTTTTTVTHVASRTTTATTPSISTRTAATTTATAPPVYFQGTGGRVQRPSTLELTGDGTLFVSGVQWTSWGGPEATGTGNAEYHGCTPSCAQAASHQALVSIRLSTIRVCSGRQYYSGVTLTLNSGRRLAAQFLQRSWSPC